MESLSIDPAISSNRELLPLVDRANKMLDRELGPSSGTVSASWSLAEDRGRPVLWLDIKDWSGQVKGGFAPDELMNERQTAARINRLWGDLLQQRSHAEIKSLRNAKHFMDGSEALDEIVHSVSDFTERNGEEPKTLKLPIRHAAALMKLGPSYWGEFFQKIRESGIHAFKGQTLLGMRVDLVPGVGAELKVE